MTLSDTDIKKAVEAGTITIKGFDKERLGPVSYDILLGNNFILTDAEDVKFIDPVKKIFPKTHEVVIPDGGEFILHPGVSILGISDDFFGSDEFLIQLSGKSSLARIGLLVHNTAGIINPGHFLNITLELCNLNSVPIILRPKMRIGQLTFSQLSSPVINNYKKVGRFSADNWNHYKKPKSKKASN